jgi:hypothetical protein
MVSYSSSWIEITYIKRIASGAIRNRYGERLLGREDEAISRR